MHGTFLHALKLKAIWLLKEFVNFGPLLDLMLVQVYVLWYPKRIYEPEDSYSSVHLQNYTLILSS